MSFLVVKAIHVISIICWVAALLYLPRLFVYHASNSQDEKIHSVFCLMERKLITIIMNPSMSISVLSGALMLYIDISYMSFWWMHVKLLCVLFLICTHFYLILAYKRFENHSNTQSHKFFRMLNEIPTIIMIIIVFLIILKP